MVRAVAEQESELNTHPWNSFLQAACTSLSVQKPAPGPPACPSYPCTFLHVFSPGSKGSLWTRMVVSLYRAGTVFVIHLHTCVICFSFGLVLHALQVLVTYLGSFLITVQMAWA